MTPRPWEKIRKVFEAILLPSSRNHKWCYLGSNVSHTSGIICATSTPPLWEQFCLYFCLNLTPFQSHNLKLSRLLCLTATIPPPFRTWIVKPVQERNVQIYTNILDFRKPSYKSFLVDPFLKTLYMYVYLYMSSPDNLKLSILLNLRIIVAEKYLNPLPKWCEKENDFKSHIDVWV